MDIVFEMHKYPTYISYIFPITFQKGLLMKAVTSFSFRVWSVDIIAVVLYFIQNLSLKWKMTIIIKIIS